MRTRLRLTQAELASKISSDQKSLSRAETGRTFVSTKLLEKIAAATGTELRVEFLPKRT